MPSVDLYVVHYNQERIIKLISAYWKLYPLRKLFVFDNMSTDGSLAYIRSSFNDVEVILNTTPKKDNRVILDWKNNAWKSSRGLADFVIVCDCDEVLFSKDWNKILTEMEESGCSYLKTPPNLCSVVPNGLRSVKTELAHESTEVKFIRDDGSFGKVLLFDPNVINESNYSPGAHSFNPTGTVKEYKGHVEFIHYDYFSLPELLLRYRTMAERRSTQDIRAGFGSHYTLSRDKLMECYESRLKVAMSFDEISDWF